MKNLRRDESDRRGRDWGCSICSSPPPCGLWSASVKFAHPSIYILNGYPTFILNNRGNAASILPDLFILRHRKLEASSPWT